MGPEENFLLVDSKEILLLRGALSYLDNCNGLTEIKQKCQFYKTVEDSTFEFIIDIDIHHLIDICPTLGNLVLCRLSNSQRIFLEVVYTAISALNLLPRCESSTQLSIVLRLKSLPDLPEYRLISAAHLYKTSSAGNVAAADTSAGVATAADALESIRLLRYIGVVTGMSVVHKYTKSARYVCMDGDGCPGATGNRFIRLYGPGTRESITVQGTFTCSFCGGRLREDVSSRLLADRRIVEVVDEKALLLLDDYSSSHGLRCQAISVYLRDSLVAGIEIGQRLSIIGHTVIDVMQNVAVFEANNVEVLDEIRFPHLQITKSLTVPDVIMKLYRDRKHSPFSFGLSLAYAFGDMICPPGTYFSIKLGLLLSLLSAPVQDDISDGSGSTALDVLAVGEDCSVIGRLMTWAAAHLASRQVIHRAGGCLTASVARGRHADTGATFVEGGSVLLAGRGICCIADLSTLSKPQKQALVQVLETGSIAVPGTSVSSSCSGALPPLRLQRRSSVWSCLDSSCSSKRRNGARSLVDCSANNNAGNSNIEDVIIDMFPMVFFTDVPCDSYAENLLMQHCLDQALNPHCVDSPGGAKPLIPLDDLKKFIEYARSMELDLSAEAQDLIQRYFVASRAVRVSAVGGDNISIPPPVSGIRTITQLAMAHARLNLRGVAADVVAGGGTSVVGGAEGVTSLEGGGVGVSSSGLIMTQGVIDEAIGGASGRGGTKGGTSGIVGETRDVTSGGGRGVCIGGGGGASGVVTDLDAVMGIYLYEEMLTARTGVAVLAVPRLTHLRDNNLHAHIGPGKDAELLEFRDQLKRFLTNHSSESFSASLDVSREE